MLNINKQNITQDLEINTFLYNGLTSKNLLHHVVLFSTNLSICMLGCVKIKRNLTGKNQDAMNKSKTIYFSFEISQNQNHHDFFEFNS